MALSILIGLLSALCSLLDAKQNEIPRFLSHHKILEEAKTSGADWWIAAEASVRNVMPPDVELESRLDQCALIRRRGFACETHYAITSDGFILTVFRIPPIVPTSKLPILLQHGVFDCSFTWINNEADESLGYLLAAEGYDVWFGNVRGNMFSRNHTSLSPDDRRFWWWTFDEMAALDLPAMVQLVLSFSGARQLIYVGHSLGTTIGFAGLSTNEWLSDHIRLFVALAPVAKVSHVKGPITALEPYALEVTAALELTGTGELLPNSELLKWIGRNVCMSDILSLELCAKTIDLFLGPGTDSFNVTRIPVYVSHAPAGSSVLSALHVIQELKADKFQMMDFGLIENLNRYGQITPPVYDIKRIRIPIGLFWSSIDTDADPEDVIWIIQTLDPNILVANHLYTQYSHIGFVWSPSARFDLYKEVIELIKKFQSD